MFYFGVFIVCLVCLVIFRRRILRDSDVPVLPGKWPVIGHSYYFAKDNAIKDIVIKTGNFAIQNGNVCKMYLMTHPVYVTTNPEDALNIMNKCLKKMFLYKLITPIFGNQLISAEVPTWKRSRRLADLAFKQHVLDEYIDFFYKQAGRLTDLLAKEVGKGDVDITEIIISNVLESTCHTTMGGSSYEIAVKEKYVNAIHSVLKVITLKVCKPWLLIDHIFNMTSLSNKFYDGINTILKHSEQMVMLRQSEYANRIKTNEDSNSAGTKFRSCLDILIESSAGPNGFSFTNNEFRDIVDNILVASFDTTTYELIFILVCIGSYSEVQEKIYHEIVSILGDKEGVTKDQLPRFVYLEAAIKEALRLFPIAPFIGREVDEDVQLNNITVPRGSSILVNVYAINRHKKHWGADADDYNPDRWLDPERVPVHPAVFCSFAPWRRGCIGKQYVMMYLKTTLIAVLRRFKLKSDYKRMKLNCYLMFKPESGHLIELNLR